MSSDYRLQLKPVNATCGALVEGIDLAQLDDGAWRAVYAAFLEYGLLIFPRQNLSSEQQGEFARRFGPVEKLNPKQRGATIAISNQKADGSLAGPGEFQYEVLKGNEGWHTDSTYMPLASKAAMLYAIELPPEGGETEFADMRAAWEALSTEEQTSLEKLSAYHSLYYSQHRSGFEHKTDNIYGLHTHGAPLRPVVKVHPETGHKSLYTGRHAYGLQGMSEAASQAYLDDLLERACQPPRVYRHVWQVGDLVVWDNRCLMHRARPYDPAHARVLRGSRISGDPESEWAASYPDPRADAYEPEESTQR